MASANSINRLCSSRDGFDLVIAHLDNEPIGQAVSERDQAAAGGQGQPRFRDSQSWGVSGGVWTFGFEASGHRAVVRLYPGGAFLLVGAAKLLDALLIGAVPLSYLLLPSRKCLCICPILRHRSLGTSYEWQLGCCLGGGLLRVFALGTWVRF